MVDTINNSSQSNRLYKDITNSPQRNHYLFELDLNTQDDMQKKGQGYCNSLQEHRIFQIFILD